MLCWIETYSHYEEYKRQGHQTNQNNADVVHLEAGGGAFTSGVTLNSRGFREKRIVFFFFSISFQNFHQKPRQQYLTSFVTELVCWWLSFGAIYFFWVLVLLLFRFFFFSILFFVFNKNKLYPLVLRIIDNCFFLFWDFSCAVKYACVCISDITFSHTAQQDSFLYAWIFC